jgi:predicted dithiol-disulfide oxidoreductase (DUF899 family)
MEHRVVSEGEWVSARKALLEQEKALTAARDEVAAARRALPWVRVTSEYAFDGPSGRVALPDLFEGRGQLVVYHFMFAPDWEAGCKSCSFWADGFERARPHLAARDVTLCAVSIAPLDRLLAFRTRMGWTFPWYSSAPSTFNRDLGVTLDGSGTYNFAPSEASGELPGLSVFARDEGAVYRTYSCYARGLDAINPAYQILDLVPQGRDEGALEWPMAWVRHHDGYGP